MRTYEHRPIELKWQRVWEEEQAFAAVNGSKKKKYYALIEFPYPSGEGLHVGHPRPYVAMDIVARKRRMEGYNVLFPMGFDAFGLPAENYAMKHHVHPSEITRKNIERFTGQMKMIGLSFDWPRAVDTTDPNYYKWTQWIFLKMFDAGLAYKAEVPINYCVSCRVGLANEEVVGGLCERCGGEVVRRIKSQWMLKITAYADKLLSGLDGVDYIERARTQQRNWIGRSEGAQVKFALEGAPDALEVYTTRPDTLFGATYMVVSPEHAMIEKYKDKIDNYAEVAAYREEASKKSDFERTELVKEKTGVELKGLKAINPVTGKSIPVWTSDYVLTGYGTGAIMAVPGHDGRDWEFAAKFGLPIVEVVAGGDIAKEAYEDIERGTMVNSGFLNGMSVEEAKSAIIAHLKDKGLGEPRVNYKLRDWVFSRQRYWGEPIPVVHCGKCGVVRLPDSALPLTLPELEKWEPNEDGESPLANLTSWVNTTCPACGGPAKRETDTMPQWAGSSWYFLRYTDPHNDGALASKEALEYWMPVDWYNGGMEHTTLHLLYSRFWHQFLYDQGVVNTPEPYKKRTSHGFILGENGEKMSKSRGNVINPDDVCEEIGADAFRLYEMFIGAFDQPVAWSQNGARGCKRFLDRVWRLMGMRVEGGVRDALKLELNAAVKGVGDDIEKMKFNTAVAKLMSLLNAIYDAGSVTTAELKTLLLLLCPFAPHMSEEMWQEMNLGGRLIIQPWPKYDPDALVVAEVEIVVQVNGKIKKRIVIPADIAQEDVQARLISLEEVAAVLDGKPLKKWVFVPGRLLNLIV